MNRKKQCLLACMAVVGGFSMLFSVLFSNNSIVLQNVLGNDNTEWGHYNGVSSAFDKKGIRDHCRYVYLLSEWSSLHYLWKGLL